MDAMFARYLDGIFPRARRLDFSEPSNPIRGSSGNCAHYERVLSLGKALPAPPAPARFTERVMATVVADRRRGGLDVVHVVRARWPALAAAAASVIIAFFGGFWTGYGRGWAPTQGGPVTGAGQAVTAPSTSPLSRGATAEGTGLRYVRLVYVPSDPT